MFYTNVANKHLHEYGIVILRKLPLFCQHVFTPRYITQYVLFLTPHVHIFLAPHVHIFLTPHVHIFLTPHVHIFLTPHVHIFLTPHVHIFLAPHVHILNRTCHYCIPSSATFQRTAMLRPKHVGSTW